MTIINTCPPIPLGFNPNLLSTPISGFNAEYVRQISDFLKKKIDSAEFKKFPSTILKLKQKYQKCMDLYELAKIEEKEVKGKRFVKGNAPFYRPRFANRHVEYLFERLDDKRRTSKRDRRRNEISKIQGN